MWCDVVQGMQEDGAAGGQQQQQQQDRNAAAVGTYQMEVETSALVRISTVFFFICALLRVICPGSFDIVASQKKKVSDLTI